MMTLALIETRVQEIAESAADSEVAHVFEDMLYQDFITYIAKFAGGELAEMAHAVLKTQDIEFERVCA